MNQAYPALEGLNLFSFLDKDGKAVFHEGFEKLETQDEVWIEYMGLKAGEAEYSKKSVYARKIVLDDATFYIASEAYFHTGY